MAQATKAKKKAMTDAEKQQRRDALKNESKSDKFRRLAKKRVPKALKSLKAVENLANYDFTDDQRDKILDVIGGAAKRVLNAFSGDRTTEAEFTI